MLGGAATHFALARVVLRRRARRRARRRRLRRGSWAALRTRGDGHRRRRARRRAARRSSGPGVYAANLNSARRSSPTSTSSRPSSRSCRRRRRTATSCSSRTSSPTCSTRSASSARRARFVAMDSMDLWIDIARDSLERTIREVDCLILNDEELELLTGAPNSVLAAKELLELGPDGGRRQAGQVRRRPVHARGLLRAARLPARGGHRPDRRRRHLRGRLRGLRRRRGRRGRPRDR